MANNVEFKLIVRQKDEVVVLEYIVYQDDPWLQMALSECFTWVTLMERIRALQDAAKLIEPHPAIDGRTYDPKPSNY